MATDFVSMSDTKRARGLGPNAAHVVSHWKAQRVTAVANLVLLAWFLASLMMLPALDHATIIAWVRQPIVAVPLTLLTISSLWHMRLGVQVMIEDYVKGEGTLFVANLALSFYAVAVGAAALWAIFKLAFGVPHG
ncbi:MAG: succinate dehydrogenase, hydrophobic membrane anchor protein [Thermaurantiacus sp.]